MSVAWYTRILMRHLSTTGIARVHCYAVSEGVARARLHNAARRLGVTITTTLDRTQYPPTVIGTVTGPYPPTIGGGG